MATPGISISDAEEHLCNLLLSWRSRYRYTLEYVLNSRKVVEFDTHWSRRPTPHEPAPDVRVNIRFAVRYPQIKHVQKQTPDITFRIEHEEFVHRDLSNIDHHILRIIKFKTEFAKTHPLHLEQPEYFATRFKYEPLAPELFPSSAQALPSSSDSTNPPVSSLTAALAGKENRSNKLTVPSTTSSNHLSASHSNSNSNSNSTPEESLVAMFSRADTDSNGYLDTHEFEQLLLNSRCGFTKKDVQIIMAQHDLNEDNKLVYGEFIPFAIDLLQAQRASAVAQEITAKNNDAAYKAAAERIKKSNELHVAMETGMQALDATESGVLSAPALRSFLQALDLQLSDREVDGIIKKLQIDVDGNIKYQQLQDSYEQILQDVILECTLEEQASEIELYLRDLLAKKDTEGKGAIPTSVIHQALTEADRINLSYTQVYAIVGDAKPETHLNIKHFCRKAAHMISALFDRTSLSEKNKLIRRSSITPIPLLQGKSKTRIEQQMRNKFVEFDTNNDGYLDPIEFQKCLADTSLCLSTHEINALRDAADLNKDGLIDIDEFMKFAYDSLLHLARDAALSNQFVNVTVQQRANKTAKENQYTGYTPKSIVISPLDEQEVK